MYRLNLFGIDETHADHLYVRLERYWVLLRSLQDFEDSAEAKRAIGFLAMDLFEDLRDILPHASAHIQNQPIADRYKGSKGVMKC